MVVVGLTVTRLEPIFKMLPKSGTKPVKLNCVYCFDVGLINYWLKGLEIQRRFCECELGQKLKRDFEFVDKRPKLTCQITSDVRLYPLDTQKSILRRSRTDLLRQAMDGLFFEDYDPEHKIAVELEFSYHESPMFYDRVENYYPNSSHPDKKVLIKGKGYPRVNELALIETHNRLIIELRYQLIKDGS